jgi:hypothetical protein
MPKKTQIQVVMETFKEKNLHDPRGKLITNPKQALAVGLQEERTAKERGVKERTFQGRTRLRPKLKKGK